MFDTLPPLVAPERTQTFVPVAVVRPDITVRSATQDELAAADVWSLTQGCYNEPLDVVTYKYGETTHAPEVIAQCRALLSSAPEGAVLLYLHRGVQTQCLNPLLPSFLHLTGHRGLSHALRCREKDGVSKSVQRFALAMLENGTHIIIVDDQQLRLGRQGTLKAAEVSIYHLIKTSGALQQALEVAL